MRDKLKKTVFGIGYMGYGRNGASRKNGGGREYALWRSMLWRCYSESALKIRPTYRGCTVSERWHNFQNFAEDIKTLKDYDLWLIKGNKMQLDKDIIKSGNRVYCLEYCKFVTPKENSRHTSQSNGKYRAFRMSDKYIECFSCISEFSEKYGLSRSTVSLCLKGEYYQTGGWLFKKL